MGSRIERESKTVKAMIELYCRKLHAVKTLCPECGELAEYVGSRLAKCPYQEGKTICAKCQTHCYKPVMREKIKKVMRYSGPRMLRHHPIAAVQHILDERRKKPLAGKRRVP